MKKYSYLYVLLIILSACTENAKMENLIDAYHNEFDSGFDKWAPTNVMDISYLDSLERRIQFSKKYQNKVLKIDSSHLNIFEIETWKTFHTKLGNNIEKWNSYYEDPSLFDVTGYLKSYLPKHGYSDTLDYLHQLQVELPRVSPHFERVKSIIIQANPAKCDLAVQKQILFLYFLQVDLPNIIKQSTLSEREQKEMQIEIDNTKIAVKDFIGFCESLSFEYYEKEIRRGETN